MDERQDAGAGAVEVKLEARPERVLIRQGGGHRHVDYVVRVSAAPREQKRRRPALALALVLDRSGSMSGDKLATAKQAALALLERLEERDQVAVVVYDSHIDTIQPTAPATGQVKAAVRAALKGVHARASTALYDGWLTGCRAIAEDRAAGEQSRSARCLLLTDGLANMGPTDPEQIAAQAAGNRENAGISTSTFGIGANYDEHLLGPMAVADGGQFHHLRSVRDMAVTFAGELSELLAVAAGQVRLELQVEPALNVDLVSDYWVSAGAERGQLAVAVGDLCSGEERHIVVRLGFPRRDERDGWPVRARLVWSAGGAEQAGDWLETRFRYAGKQECDAERRDAAAMHWVGLHHVERAKREATERSRRGDLSGARDVLHGVARCVVGYAKDDSALHAALDELEEVQREVTDAPVSAMYAKEMRYRTQRSSRGQRDHRADDPEE